MPDNDVGDETSTPPTQPSWVGDTQDALNRTIDALQVAWDTSRDARLAALTSAKRTVAELTEAVEEGIAAANARWATTQSATAAGQPPESDPEPGDDSET